MGPGIDLATQPLSDVGQRHRAAAPGHASHAGSAICGGDRAFGARGDQYLPAEPGKAAPGGRSREKRLLVETALPVKTVARLAGFSSTERLRVTFVEREGTSPTVFRKQALQMRKGSEGFLARWGEGGVG